MRSIIRIFLAITLIVLTGLITPAQAEEAGNDTSFFGRQIENALTGPSRVATVTGFSGLLSGRAEMESLTFSDDDGVWLSLEGIKLDWQRQALLSGELRVAEMSAERLQILREPLPSDSLVDDIPDASASGFKIPELPVLVDIDKIGIDRVELGEQLLGIEAVLTLEGRVTLAAGEADTEIAVRRIDGPRGLISLTAKSDNQSGIFTLDLQAREQEGGLIGALLNIPDNPQLDMSVTGEGTLSDFQAQLRLATERQDRLQGELTIAELEDGRQGFDADLSGDVTELFAPQYKDFFGENLSLKARGSKASDGSMELEQLDLNAQSVTLSGTGLIDGDGTPVRFDLAGRISDETGDRVVVPSTSDISLQNALLDLNFDAEVSDNWDFTFDLLEPHFGDTKLDRALLTGGGTITETAQGAQVLADLTHLISGFDSADPGLNAAVGSEISGILRASWSKEDALQITRLTVSGTDYGMEFTGALDITDGTALIEGDVTVEAEDLSRFSLYTGQDLTGAAVISMQGAGDLLGGGYDAALQVDGQDISIGQDEIDALLAGEPVEFSTTVKRDETGTELEEFSLSSTAVSGTGQGKIGEVGSELDLAFELSDLGLILPDYSGPATLTAHSLELAEEWYIVDVALNGPYDVTATLKGDIGGRADALVDLDISVPELAPLTSEIAGAEHVTGPFRISGTALNPDDDRWTMELLADLPFDATAELEGEVEDDTAHMDYALTLPDLGQAVPQVAEYLSGALSAHGTVQKSGSDWIIDTDLDGPHQIDATANARLSDQNIDVEYSANVPNLAAVIPSLEGGAQWSGTAHRQDDQPWALTANGTGPWQTAFDAQGQYGTDRTSAQLSARLPDISAIVPGLSGVVDVTANAASAGDGYDIKASASGASGLSADADGHYQAGASVFDITANADDIGIFVPSLSGAVTAEGRVQETPDGWNIDLGTQGPAATTTNITGTADQSFESMSIALKGTAPLALANASITPRSIEGVVDFDLTLDGPPALSSLSGLVETQNAQLADPILRQTFRNISARAVLSGETAQVDATIAGGRGGNIQISGPISLSEQLSADLDLRLNNLVLEDPALYTTTLGGRLSLDGPLAESGRISGQIDVGRTEIQVPSGGLGFGSSILEMDHVNEPNTSYQTRVRAKAVSQDDDDSDGGSNSGSGGVYSLDIDVDAPNQIYLRGRGLDIEMGGDMQIIGTTNDPQAIGGIRVVRGQLSILGKQLSFSEDSQITLSGDLTPYLDLTATSDTGDYTVIIAVTGTVDDPEFNFSSEPELPQDEVLSQFLFGSSVSDLTPLQAIQLAASIADLAGYGTSGIGKFRNAIGLDTLNISTNSDGTTDVTAGKYLSEKIYTDVVSSSDGDAKVRLNIDLTDSITVRGAAGNDGETSIGIFFEKDY